MFGVPAEGFLCYFSVSGESKQTFQTCSSSGSKSIICFCDQRYNYFTFSHPSVTCNSRCVVGGGGQEVK